MPIQIPNLDDKDYDDLVSEAVSLIPRYAPTWTNHNASDPGITLIELLAYFTEMLTYRLDRVSQENKINFLRLLLGSEGVNIDELKDYTHEDIERMIQQAVLNLRQPQRAVTSQDYEYLAKQAMLRFCPDYKFRVHCVVGKNLEADGVIRDVDCPGHVSLIVVVDQEIEQETYINILNRVYDDLEPRRLLTTRLHITQPCNVWVSLSVSIRPTLGAKWSSINKLATDALHQFFNPLTGGNKDKRDSPFGYNLYLSKVYDVLENVQDVDYIEKVSIRRLALSEADINTDQAIIGMQIGVTSTVGVDTLFGSKLWSTERLILDGEGKIAGIKLKPYELIRIVMNEKDIQKAE